MVVEERTFYRRWIVANGLAEAGGLGTTFELGQAVAPALEQIRGLTAILGSALAAVALGTLLGSSLCCVRSHRPRGRRDSWAGAREAPAKSGADTVAAVVCICGPPWKSSLAWSTSPR